MYRGEVCIIHVYDFSVTRKVCPQVECLSGHLFFSNANAKAGGIEYTSTCIY